MLLALIDRFLARKGYMITRCFPPDVEPEFKAIYDRVRIYTLTTPERMYALYKAIEYVAKFNVPGDVVECGVWRGGSAMICALALQQFNDAARRLFLYDTYEGMPAPTQKDISIGGQNAVQEWQKRKRSNGSDWCYSPLEEVKANLASTGYPADKLIFVKGKVEETIPGTIPEAISLLRLDTDFYESTEHELLHLFPRLSRHGILIIDDYGHWRGQKEAVNAYFAQHNTKILLDRVDYSCRLAVKL